MSEPIEPGGTPQGVPYRDDLRRVERAAFGAWPAFETADVEGWVWRFSGGGFGRSNSVFTVDFSGSDPVAAIARAEDLFRRRGRRARFRLSDVTEPAGLQRLLEARGYIRETGGLILAKPVESRNPDLTGVEWSNLPTPHWLKVYLGVLDEPRRRIVADILAAVPQPRAFACIRKRGITLSCGLGTMEDGIVTIECIASREETRRRGGARAILGAIETWAGEEGGHTLHLNVADTNAPAIALYRSFGMEEVGRFSYWVPDAIAMAPPDLGKAAQFPQGRKLPPVTLAATSGSSVDPVALPGRTVLVIYPWTGRPGLANPIEWDEILGAHGSTPELEGFRDHYASLAARCVRLLAVSGQSLDHQRELVERLMLPFDVLSDADGHLREAWNLPVFAAGKQSYLSRMTLVLRDSCVEHCFAPVHPPAAHAAEVLAWVAAHPD